MGFEMRSSVRRTITILTAGVALLEWSVAIAGAAGVEPPERTQIARSLGCPPVYPYEAPGMSVAEAFMLVARRREIAPQAAKLAMEFLLSFRIVVEPGKCRSLSFYRLDFSGGTLFDANLPGGFFSNANFQRAHLPYINLCAANLQNSDFRNADLVAGSLRGAYLLRADFFGANLDKVDLTDAMISGAKLRQARGLRQEQIDSACYIPRTGRPELPAGFHMPPVCQQPGWGYSGPAPVRVEQPRCRTPDAPKEDRD